MSHSYLSGCLNCLFNDLNIERKTTWRRFIKSSVPSTPNHAHSAGSTDTELSTLDINTQELWLPESR